MRKLIVLVMLVTVGAAASARTLGSAETKRVQAAAAVLNELKDVPDKDVPGNLWSSAKCVMVIPGVKRGAFIVGGEYGKGLASCRTSSGWSAPVFFKLQKGSVGFQIGGAEVDLVLLVMNDRGMERLLGNKVTLGTQATVAAGPVGRNAEAATDARMTAEILSWSRSRGVFAGINLSGGQLSPDTEDTQDLYGKPVEARDVLVVNSYPTPPEGAPFVEALRQHDAAVEGGGK